MSARDVIGANSITVQLTSQQMNRLIRSGLKDLFNAYTMDLVVADVREVKTQQGDFLRYEVDVACAPAEGDQ